MIEFLVCLSGISQLGLQFKLDWRRFGLPICNIESSRRSEPSWIGHLRLLAVNRFWTLRVFKLGWQSGPQTWSSDEILWALSSPTPKKRLLQGKLMLYSVCWIPFQTCERHAFNPQIDRRNSRKRARETDGTVERGPERQQQMGRARQRETCKQDRERETDEHLQSGLKWPFNTLYTTQ